MKYKVVIVDDEEPARDLLENYVNKIDELDIAGIYNNALEAKRKINQEQVDILLTDIQMDDLTGIELIKTLKNPPVSIFTTAYSEYALEGFDLDVIDYLVKPISFQRFCVAIDKAIELVNYRNETHSKSTEQTKKQTGNTDNPTFFFVKTNRKIVKVEFMDLLFVESFGEYVKLHTKEDVLLALQSTNFMEELLPSSDFIIVHRSHIININHIKEIIGNEILIDRHRLLISKRRREGFMAFIRSKGIV